MAPIKNGIVSSNISKVILGSSSGIKRLHLNEDVMLTVLHT